MKHLGRKFPLIILERMSDISKVLKPIFLYSSFCGIAPYKFNNNKFEVDCSRVIFSYLMFLLNLSFQIYYMWIIYESELYEGLLSGSFILSFDLLMCFFANSGIYLMILKNKFELCEILNKIISLQYLINIKKHLKYLFLLNIFLVTFCILTSLIIGYLDKVVAPIIGRLRK